MGCSIRHWVRILRVMRLQGTSHKGSYDLLVHGEKYTALEYKGFFSGKASADLAGSSFAIQPKNMLHTKYDVLLDETVIGGIKYNWKGQILIDLMGKSGLEHTFILKSKGFWKQRYVLFNAIEEQELVLKPDTKFLSAKHNYDVEMLGPEMSDVDVFKLVLCCAFAVNLYLRMAAAAAS